MVDAGGGCGEPGDRIAGGIQRETGQQMSAEDEMRGSYRVILDNYACISEPFARTYQCVP